MIHIYGDSFSEPLDVDFTWPRLLGQTSRQDVMNYSFAGASLAYTWHSLQTSCDTWQPGDRIIITLTDTFRTWFWKDKPHFSGIHLTNLSAMAGASERDKIAAMQQYYRYLQQEHLLVESMISRLGWLSARAGITGNPVMILRCFEDFSNQFFSDISAPFDNITVFQGALAQDVSLLEIEPTIRDWVYCCDPRANHMIRDNHSKLVDLLISVMQGSADADLLSVAWDREVITEPNLRDPQWASQQIMPERLSGLFNLERPRPKSRYALPRVSLKH